MLILQRYVLRSLVLNFLITFLVITGVFFIAGCVRVLYTKDGALDVVSFLRVLPLLMIQTSSVTVPMSLLVAVVLSYGRLASDNEIIAVLMGGVHPYWILSPALLVGLALSFVNLLINTEFVPRAREVRDALVKTSVSTYLSSLTTDSNNLKLENFRMHYRFRDEDDWFHDVTIYMMTKDHSGALRLQDGFPIRAARARPRVDAANRKFVVELRDVQGQVEVDRSGAGRKKRKKEPKDGEPRRSEQETGTEAGVADASDGSGQTEPAGPDPDREDLMTMRFEGFNLNFTFAELLEDKQRERNVDELTSYELLGYRAVGLELRYFEYRYTLEYHKRIAGAFACLVFVLIGAPLGIFFRRGGQLEAFLVSFLLVMVFYYPFMVAGESLASNGKIPAIVGAWLADGISLLLGGALMLKLFRS